jgi:hypothetical protein
MYASKDTDINKSMYSRESTFKSLSKSIDNQEINQQKLAKDSLVASSPAGMDDVTIAVSSSGENRVVRVGSGSDDGQIEIEESGLSCWQTFIFFLKHAKEDLLRRKCHFCLAFCTVMIVVISTLVVNTIISKGPIVFMKLAEEDSGQIDGTFYSKN